MLTLEEARDFLRVDGEDNDLIIKPILEAIPAYIETATGMTPENQKLEPMAKQVAKFILSLWYNAEQTDHEKIQKVIDSLLTAMKYKHYNESLQ